MNVPPTDGVTVPLTDLRELVENIFTRIPIPVEHARLIAELLIDTELRGVVSHGVANVKRYVRSYQRRRTNRHPQVNILRDESATATLSGDGGLGMIVATAAMQTVMRKATEYGVGIATSTYHAHIGSAGKYVRMALRKNLIGITFSGRSTAPSYKHGSTIYGSVQGSPPLAFGVPAGKGRPSFFLDMGSRPSWDEECFKKMPDVIIKALGISHVANLLSGTLGGQMLPEFDRRTIEYPDAEQSAFYMALDVDRFVPLKSFTDDVDRLMAETSKMTPLPGFTESTLPGGRAWRKEQQYLKEGIPISAQSMRSLSEVAHEYGVSVPWEGV